MKTRSCPPIDALCMIALLVAFLLGSPSSEAADRPNIIVFFSDDHGWADLACQEIEDDLKTPNIDKLAARGVRMTDGYVTAPQCVPSRAGLLAGRSQNRFGVEANGYPINGFDRQTTIGERLQSTGYVTGMAGKWHLGPAAEIESHGFDFVYYKNSNRPGWANFSIDGSRVNPGPERQPGYHLDVCSDAVCGFIDAHHDRPFFFYCAYRAPHVPLDAPQKYLDRFPGEMPERRRQALAMISAMDDGVEQVVETLRRHAIEEQTLIFYIGDNGAPLKIHKLDAPGGGPGWDGSHNLPMNGEKGMLSEGGIRVPFVASWPGTIPAGTVYTRPVSSLDVAATACAIAGIETKPGELDGTNLIPYLTGNRDDDPHEAIYWRWLAQAAVREGDWKYLRGGDRAYLFNLKTDFEETNNQIDDHPDIAKRLLAKLTDWSSEMQPPGIATSTMSESANRYFDHYLDGQPTASSTNVDSKKRPRQTTQESKPSNATLGNSLPNGWTARGGNAYAKGNELVSEPANGERGGFIAIGGLDLPKETTAVVTVHGDKQPNLRFAWRTTSHRTFQTGNIAEFAFVENSRQARVSINADGPIIHGRLLFPTGGASIRSLSFESPNGATLKQWRF